MFSGEDARIRHLLLMAASRAQGMLVAPSTSIPSVSLPTPCMGRREVASGGKEFRPIQGKSGGFRGNKVVSGEIR